MKKLFQLFIIFLIISCSSNNQKSSSTILDSDDYETSKERVEILSKEITVFSKILDAEFELFNVNGFSNQRKSVPGASSLDYKFAIFVNREDISKWTEGMTETSVPANDYDWTNEILKNKKAHWKLNSTPKYYIRKGENVVMIVYQDEGTIFKRVIQD
jgi:crotonobetainyl-CoA:carnitine CoA-transferase CaiB-like acyl-CoA transferase